MARTGSRSGSGSKRTSRANADPDAWREEMLAEFRRIIHAADPEVVEERKWKKPSRPEGVPVWSHGGILCVCDSLKGRMRLTFPRGASLKDPKHRFNARLDSRTVRAIDVPEGEPIDEGALQEWIRGAAALNAAAAKKR